MLRFENISAGYNGTERLHGVTARLDPGSLTAVIGPNGSGKSTLLKCAAGVHRLFGGQILIDGRPLNRMNDRQRAQLVAYMPQSRLTPEITVRQLAAHGRFPHLKWGRSPSASDNALVEQALQRTGLTDLADRPVANLSGGERQRAYIAMMLAQQSPVMLLDEPTAFLDLSAQFSLMALLRSLCREGRSAVVVLHDLALAMEYADALLLLHEGRLVAAGSPDKVFDSGRIRQVFGVDARRTDGGYLFSPMRKEVQP